MTAPSATDASGLAKGTAVSVDIVKDSLLGSFATIGGVLLPVLLGALVIAFLAVCTWAGRRVASEALQGRSAVDPRQLVDPSASDVLGEW